MPICSGFPTYCRWAHDSFRPADISRLPKSIRLCGACAHSAHLRVSVCLTSVCVVLGPIAYHTFALIAVHAFYKCARTNQLAYFSFLWHGFHCPARTAAPLPYSPHSRGGCAVLLAVYRRCLYMRINMHTIPSPVSPFGRERRKRSRSRRTPRERQPSPHYAHIPRHAALLLFLVLHLVGASASASVCVAFFSTFIIFTFFPVSFAFSQAFCFLLTPLQLNV